MARVSVVPVRPLKSLGLTETNTRSFMRAIDAGIAWTAVAGFLEMTGLAQQQLAEYLDVPLRTLARRREAGSLNKYESERILRLAEVFEAGMHLFEDGAKVLEWLLSPSRGLNMGRPIDFARTDFGAREVRNLIGRLEHGVFS